eukprot:113676-Lingulodinium_polyedra.AAC.1
MIIFFVAARAPRLDLHQFPGCDVLRGRIVCIEPKWRGRHGSGDGLVYWTSTRVGRRDVHQAPISLSTGEKGC